MIPILCFFKKSGTGREGPIQISELKIDLYLNNYKYLQELM